LVPCLLAVLASKVPEAYLMKTVLATSLATIPFTGAWPHISRTGKATWTGSKSNSSPSAWW
jgi:hypothetical protein